VLTRVSQFSLSKSLAGSVRDLNRSSQFQGPRQQDSHELLRHLMDGMRQELKTTQSCELLFNAFRTQCRKPSRKCCSRSAVQRRASRGLSAIADFKNSAFSSNFGTTRHWSSRVVELLTT